MYRIKKVKIFAYQIFETPKSITLHKVFHMSLFITNLIFILALHKKKYIGA